MARTPDPPTPELDVMSLARQLAASPSWVAFDDKLREIVLARDAMKQQKTRRKRKPKQQ